MSLVELRRKCEEKGVTPAPNATREELELAVRDLMDVERTRVTELRMFCIARGLFYPAAASADHLRTILQRGTNTLDELKEAWRDRGWPVPANAVEEDLQRRLQRQHELDQAADAAAAAAASTETAGSGGAGDEDEPMSLWRQLRALPSALSQGYDDLVQAVIRPPRAQYDNRALGKTAFRIGVQAFERFDFELVNERGLKLVCSWWGPRGFRERASHAPMPAVIYLHGNSSCRAESLEALPPLLNAGVTLLAFDFAGSGLSEGEYVSLGWYEREDLGTVVKHVRESGLVSTIGLWGRSMGAVTALLFVDRDPSIACVVCDSPFASFRLLAQELVESAQVRIPGFAVGLAMRAIRSSCKTRAKFDVFKIEPIENAPKCFVPALFAAAEGDVFIRPHHAQKLHDAYGGDKNIVLFPGNHNTPRPGFFLDSAMIFVMNTMVEPARRASTASRVRASHTSPTDVVGVEFHMPAPMAVSGGSAPSSGGVLRPADVSSSSNQPPVAAEGQQRPHHVGGAGNNDNFNGEDHFDDQDEYAGDSTPFSPSPSRFKEYGFVLGATSRAHSSSSGVGRQLRGNTDEVGSPHSGGNEATVREVRSTQDLGNTRTFHNGHGHGDGDSDGDVEDDMLQRVLQLSLVER